MAQWFTEALLLQKRSVRALGLITAAAQLRQDKDLLAAIRREERRHYYLLEGIYEETTGKPFAANRAALSLPKNYPDMLRTAICDKLAAIDFYEELIINVKCVRQKELLVIIISDQKEHARILASIYSRL